MPPLPLPLPTPLLCLSLPPLLLPSAPSVFWDPLIQRPSSTSYLRSVGSNQTPLACRHIQSSKKTKGRVAVGRVCPLPFNSHKSFNHDTDRNYFFFPSVSLDMPVFSALLLFLLMYLSSPLLYVLPLSSQQSYQIAGPPSSLLLLSLPPPSLSAYCRALMSVLARSVNYSITGRRISDPPLVIPKIDLCWE